MGVALVMAQSSPLEHAGWRGWGWKSGGGGQDSSVCKTHTQPNLSLP